MEKMIDENEINKQFNEISNCFDSIKSNNIKIQDDIKYLKDILNRCEDEILININRISHTIENLNKNSLENKKVIQNENINNQNNNNQRVGSRREKEISKDEENNETNKENNNNNIIKNTPKENIYYNIVYIIPEINIKKLYIEKIKNSFRIKIKIKIKNESDNVIPKNTYIISKQNNNESDLSIFSTTINNGNEVNQGETIDLVLFPYFKNNNHIKNGKNKLIVLLRHSYFGIIGKENTIIINVIGETMKNKNDLISNLF
jgi:hypothetical protein